MRPFYFSHHLIRSPTFQSLTINPISMGYTKHHNDTLISTQTMRRGKYGNPNNKLQQH